MNNPTTIDPVAFEKLREAAAKSILAEIDRSLLFIQTPDSGRLVETVIQQLSDQLFVALAALVVGNEQDTLVKNLIFTITIHIANKLGMQFNDQDILNGSSNIMILINYENLRRKGHLEYAWSDNIFSKNPKYAGYVQLTEKGIQASQETILDAYTGTTIQ